MTRRATAFVVVGAVGFAVQLTALFGFTRIGWPVAVATAVAVELAVLHNFCWHQRWTWRDRPEESAWRRLLRFHAATGVVSLVANVMLTWILVRFLHLPILAANALSVAAASAGNYLAADRWVFRRAAPVAVVMADLMRATPVPSLASQSRADE
jgi:putative flippase GtrA